MTHSLIFCNWLNSTDSSDKLSIVFSVLMFHELSQKLLNSSSLPCIIDKALIVTSSVRAFLRKWSEAIGFAFAAEIPVQEVKSSTT